MSDETLLEAVALSRSFHGQQILFDISFRLNRGEILGLLGPNGAGKSTTMKILCGVLAPHSGSVAICGKPLLASGDVTAKRHIGYLPEDPPLYVDATVDEYLVYCAELKNIDHRRVNTVVDHAKSLCGLTDVGPRLIGNLSKGFKQRIGIAQAILHEPELLILDEPTNGLDPNQIREVRQLIQALAVNQALVISTHVLSEVQTLCDRVLIINRGRIVYDEALGTQQNALQVAYAKPPPADFCAELTGVRSVRTKDSTHFILGVDDRAAVTEQLLRQSIDRGLGLCELTTSSTELEQTFFELTCNDGQMGLHDEPRVQISADHD